MRLAVKSAKRKGDDQWDYEYAKAVFSEKFYEGPARVPGDFFDLGRDPVDSDADAIDHSRQLYLLGDEENTPVGIAIAHDRGCYMWMCDFWNYIRRYENWDHIGTNLLEFSWFVNIICDPEKYLGDHLLASLCTGLSNESDLYDRLMELHGKYYLLSISKNRRRRR